MNPEIIKATTPNYYPDEERIRCAFSEIEGTQIQIYMDYFDRWEQQLEFSQNLLAGDVQCVKT